MTTPVAACAAGAAIAAIARKTAAVAVAMRKFTVQESFPRGNPRETAANLSLLRTDG
jgi:hypothetical protein